jgi:3',5'-nucleoside bisphosphate phosphatase
MTPGDGIAEALAAGEELGLEVVPGTEFSAELDGRSVHVLAYWHDHTEPELAAELAGCGQPQRPGARMVERFNALGMCRSRSSGSSSSRRAHRSVGPHLAQAVVEIGACARRARGVRSLPRRRRARRRAEACGRPGPRRRAAARCGRGRGARAPALFGARDGGGGPDRSARGDGRAGLAGVEAQHPAHDRAAVDRWTALAKRYGLEVTAGSDHHGGERPTTGRGGGDGPCDRRAPTLARSLRMLVRCVRGAEARPHEKDRRGCPAWLRCRRRARSSRSRRCTSARAPRPAAPSASTMRSAPSGAARTTPTSSRTRGSHASTPSCAASPPR